MADSQIPITAGTGTNVDTRTESTNGQHRQVIVLGDPTNNLGVAPVDGVKGLAIDLTATGQNAVALKTDGSAVIQPVSGTVTANLSSVGGLALDATLTTGNLVAQLKTAAKGTTAAGQPTSVAVDANTQALHASVTNFPATQPVSGAVSVSNLPATQAVSGSVSVSNLPATQAVSATALPLPTGAATSAKQPAPGTAGTASTDVLSVQGVASMTPLKVDASATTQPVSGSVTVSNLPATQAVSGSVSVSNLPATQAVSAASLPLPTGAANSAKQPAIGTAGAASTDVLTIQGIASMTALKVDASATTQPVSGTVTANLGALNGAALDATLTGGAAKAVVRGGAKGTTTVSDVTSSASGANHQPLDVAIYDAAGNQVTTFGGGTQYATGTAQASPTGTISLGYDGANVRALATSTTGVLKVDATATTQPIAGNSASGVADTGNPVKVGGRYNATAPALVDGQRGDLQLDTVGNLKVYVASLSAGEDLATNRQLSENRFSYATSTLAATTVVKNAPGFLHRMIITGGAAGTIDLYDNASAGSGTKIASFDSTAALSSYEFNVSFANGLTAVTSAATKITYSIR